MSGPKVFLDYDQAALDRAYDQPSWAPNMQEVLARRGAAADAVRARLGEPQRFAYGDTPVEQLDVFATSRPNAPVMVFIHGGAWRGGDARSQAFAAEMFVKAGAHLVLPDFAVVMDVGLEGMVAQVCRAVAWVATNAARFGGDAGRIFVGGHSSGGHLAGNVLITDWARDFGLPADVIKGGLCMIVHPAHAEPADVIKGGLCMSGMYDLAPVRLSARSSYVKFDDRIVHELSPIRHLARVRCPVVVAYGERDSPEFQRQSREWAEALRGIGRLHTLIVGQALNHFEMPEMLADPSSPLGRAVRDLLGTV